MVAMSIIAGVLFLLLVGAVIMLFSADKKIVEIEKSLKTKGLENVTLSRELNSTRKNLEELDSKCGTTAQTIVKRNQTIEEQKARIEALKKDVMTRVDTETRLKSDIETKSKRIKELEGKIAECMIGAETQNKALEAYAAAKEKLEKKLEQEEIEREELAKKKADEITRETRENFLTKVGELSIKEKRADEAIKKAEEDSKRLEQEYNKKKQELEDETAKTRKEVTEALEKTVEAIDKELGNKIADIALMNTLAFTCSCSEDLIPCSIDFTKENTFRCSHCGSVYRVALRAEPVYLEKAISDADYEALIQRRLQEHSQDA